MLENEQSSIVLDDCKGLRVVFQAFRHPLGVMWSASPEHVDLCLDLCLDRRMCFPPEPWHTYKKCSFDASRLMDNDDIAPSQYNEFMKYAMPVPRLGDATSCQLYFSTAMQQVLTEIAPREESPIRGFLI